MPLARTAARKPPRSGTAPVEVTPDEVDDARRFGDDTRKMVSFRGDADVMERLKQIAIRTGKPYQRLLRKALRDFVVKAEAAEA